MTLPTTPAVSAITRAAQAKQLNPLALIAVAHSESGLDPRSLGDGGHAFGLFQNNNAGGTITGDPNPRRFFNPNVSSTYAANAISRLGISKLPVEAQIRAIVERYERPAAPEAEVQRSIAYYRQQLKGGLPAPAAPTPLGKPAPTPKTTPVQSTTPSSTVPSINPQALALLQSSLGQGQSVQQDAQDALGAISGHSHGVPMPLDLSPYLDSVADVQQPTAPAPTVPAPAAPAVTPKPQATKPAAVAPPPRTKGGYTVGNFEGTKVASWMVPALQFARANGWKGKLTSGLRSTELQKTLYARYQAGGNIAAKPGQSNHEIQNGGAFDATDYDQLNAILKKYPGQRPIWAESVGINDHPHFSIDGH